ncbi:MAG: mechanosensitive ion channel family protein [Peptococcaceae bacterium]|jgi:small-conductance mechanosensitive channel|nr:mechanosensitive ion channel family protein [Peptococcaceae bacterium]
MAARPARSLFRQALYFLASALVVTGLFAARQLLARRSGSHPTIIYGDILTALIILVVGYLASFIVERYVFRYSADHPGLRRQAMLRFLTRLFIYIAVAVAVLSAFGVSIGSALFGGAFLTVLVGLAGQTVLGNLLAGVALVLARPFEVGDRVTFMTWQYPLILPSYPHPTLRPVHAGGIIDINMMHTALQTDEGPVLLIPNGILIQAAIENLSRTPTRGVRFRFDVDASLDPETVAQDLRRGVEGGEWAEPGTCRVEFVDLTPDSYSLSVSFESRGLSVLEAKSAALAKAASILRGIRKDAAPASQRGPEADGP